MQISGFCPPSAPRDLQRRISVCIEEVVAWMRSNRLQLNTTKTKILWSTTGRRLQQLPQLPLRVGPDQIAPATVVRDLGIYLDSDVSMRSHVAKTARLRCCVSCGASVGQCPNPSSSLVLARLDYGNATLAGIPSHSHLLSPLQSVMNSAARLIFSSSCLHGSTTSLRSFASFTG